MRADRVEASWDPGKSKWLIRIQSGEEVIRRHCNLSKDADEQAVRAAAEKTATEEGYEFDPASVVVRREQAAAKRYPMQGEIRSLDAAAKTATINAGKIGDWMEAMTMEYPIKPDDEFAKLHVGDAVQATVVVNDLKYYVTDVKVVPKP